MNGEERPEPLGWAAEQCPECLATMPVYRGRDGKPRAYSSRLQQPQLLCAHKRLLRGEIPRAPEAIPAMTPGAAVLVSEKAS